MQGQKAKKSSTALVRIRPPVAEATLSASQASRTLMVLGLLKGGARHGYELHRIVVAHGSLYADFKKPTLYHLLHRLALQGAVAVHSEAGARGPRGERLVFGLTRRGQAEFTRLLRQALSSYDAAQTLFEVAVAFMMMLPSAEAQALLKQRREAVRMRRAGVLAETAVRAQLPHSPGMAARQLATDHAVSLMDAEIGWMDRAVRQLSGGQHKSPGAPPRIRRAVGQ